MGVKSGILTAKHGCGFLLWPTNVTLPDGKDPIPMPDARCPMPDARCPMPDTGTVKRALWALNPRPVLVLQQ